MTEKQLCSDCKHLEHDGMAGIWCGVRGNNKNYDCPKFEYNWGRLTKEEAINHLNRLYYENKQLKQAISDWKGSYDELYQDIEILEKENRQLKADNNRLVNETAKIVAEHQSKVLDLIDDKIDELEGRYKFGQEVYCGCPMHNIRFGINVLKELKRELQE